MSQNMETYIIQGGTEGSERLKILARATWPTSEQFLKEAGLAPGLRCLDMGCGNGEITFKLAECLGSTASITAIDADEKVIQIAKDEARKREITVHFIVHNIENDSSMESEYDFVYARFLLSHLRDPARSLKKMKEALKSSGVLAIEDVDFDGHFSYPRCAAFDKFVELYREAGRLKGADPLIGPKLPGLLTQAGFSGIYMKVVLPTFMRGDGKLMGLLTLKNIQNAVINANLSTKEEMERLISELESFTDDPATIMSLPRIFQVWARKE